MADEQTPVLTDDFRNGAKAMFDSLLFRAANNWHGDPAVNAACDAENKVIESWAAEALEDVSPDDHVAWKSIGRAYAQGLEAGKNAAQAPTQPGRAVMQQALDALRAVRSNMQRDAPHLSGKVWGDADAAIAALSATMEKPHAGD